MTTERIGLGWPREVDLEGFSPEYAELAPLKRIPFDMKDPLIFHVLTTLRTERALLNIMRDGGSLMPAAWADERWGDEKSMIFARDRVAGDDEYLFTTPCNVFSAHDSRARFHPAVAFRLSYVQRAAKGIAFRVHDLEPQYKQAEELVGQVEFNSEFDDDEWDELSEEEQREMYEQDVASTVSQELEDISDCGTQYDKRAAVALTKLYARVIGSFRYDTTWVPEDDPLRLSLYKKARGLFPDCILEEDTTWAEESFVGPQIAQLKESWGNLFGAPGTPLPVFPSRLLSSPAQERPELLVRGSLALCEAAFYRDARGAWRRVPHEVCEEGRGR
jgi:hypothetical protein